MHRRGLLTTEVISELIELIADDLPLKKTKAKIGEFIKVLLNQEEGCKEYPKKRNCVPLLLRGHDHPERQHEHSPVSNSAA